MTRILLTTTALVAFAGAAAADVSFSGEAEFSYNDATGFASNVEVTGTGSVALDNGMTASASITVADTTAASAAVAGTVTGGDISLSSDSASISYNVGFDGDGAAYVGEALAHQGTTAAIFQADPSADAGISASATMGGATVSASINAANELEVGLGADLGGSAITAGYDEASGFFGAQMAGAAGGADYTLAFASNDSYGLEVGTSAAGADLTLNFGSAAGVSGWTVGASMPLGDATVSAEYSDDESWEVGFSTDLEGVSLGATFGQTAAGAADTWEITAGLSQGAVALDASFNQANAVELTASYDMGNGLMAYAGYLEDGSTTTFVDATYFGVEYDLGGGAALTVSNADLGAGYLTTTDFGQDYAAGTTVSVSFSF